MKSARVGRATSNQHWCGSSRHRSQW